ncbi:triose-phosphate isomerase [Sphingomicrobium clamense]|uniref:Triosephosphate isomerase n=1 Tax=Sphingomicrobium clamense TaxID=2851013 RepID=A0ABS6V5V3_9SPHN|nr:triose-phosphate isomerase [Sphingomicrobium sp. B8]MBW0144945.1 triose-phosphate isomerase [Sphingomicrobium sp. B8]
MARRKLIAGNWKMHGIAGDLGEITRISMASETLSDIDTAICVPATLIERASEAAPGFVIGGQDVHAEPRGAFTGSISAAMLVDAGAETVIVGHSERREAFGETDAQVAAKAAAALAAGLDVIVCCGESLDVREAGNALETVGKQIVASLPGEIPEGKLSVAYEPIWAIGTGKVAGPDEIREMHAHLRGELGKARGETFANETKILYGGSVKGENAGDILHLDHVDGALVGGASLTADQFIPIMNAAAR